MTDATIAPGGQAVTGAGGAERTPIAGRLEALTRAVERSRRRQFDVRQIMLIAGSALMALGFLAIVLGWYGAAHSAYVFQEVPYLISGGLLGVALMAGGGFVFFAAWLVRMIDEDRASNTRMAQTLDRIDRALGAQPIPPPPSWRPPALPSDRVVGLPRVRAVRLRVRATGTVGRDGAAPSAPQPPGAASPEGERRRRPAGTVASVQRLWLPARRRRPQAGRGPADRGAQRNV
ncbi:MAG TPA: hypothetical protein VEG62_08365, partial [Acidimicrobiales bacterium]|nr:hypothetical protein [Acidimicrobiales bacterium]